jgi:hypothetical protein
MLENQIFAEMMRNRNKISIIEVPSEKVNVNSRKSILLRNHDFEGLDRFFFDINRSGL